MYKETKIAVEIIKQIKDIDFKIIRVSKDVESNYDVIQLKINEPDFRKRLDLKHKIVDIVREKVYAPSRFYITGAI